MLCLVHSQMGAFLSKGVLEFLPFVCLAMCAELWKRLKQMEGDVEFCDLMPVLQLNPREVSCNYRRIYHCAYLYRVCGN